MREMHKWKDKVELSLDNRQIFFLFFGLSVVGCFVFALGVMCGRRVDWGATGGEVAVQDDGAGVGSLAMLDADAVRERLSFPEGLSVPATEGLPPTRDPDSVGQPAAEQGDAPKDVALASAAPGLGKGDSKAKGAKAKAKGNKAKGNKAKGAKASAKAKPAVAYKLSGKFTLQMKAFARPDQAEAFANTLRANGHTVRVEPHEVKGRIWHRVRVGAFKTWSEGLAAKESFESHESVIAYVVRL